MVIAANIDPMFRRLCQAMGQPGLAEDPRFVSHVARGHNMATLDGIIGEWTRTLSKEELFSVLDANGVVCGPIYSIADIAADPHFQARDMILRTQRPALRRHRRAGHRAKTVGDAGRRVVARRRQAGQGQ